MFEGCLENVRASIPLVHCITNYVTVNDVANVLIACGGAPLMSDDLDDAVEITGICGGLDINIGTLNARTIPTMFATGKRANELGHPVVLDPVGAGASKVRTQTAYDLMDQIGFAVIRGNISEIRTLATGEGSTRGVDAAVADVVTEQTIESGVDFARAFAERTGSVIAISGAIDIVADADRAYIIRNGHPLMARITGSGCMLTAILAAYQTANREDPLKAAAAAVCMYGIAGQRAAERMQPRQGNATYRTLLIDAVNGMQADDLEDNADYELVVR